MSNYFRIVYYDFDHAFVEFTLSYENVKKIRLFASNKFISKFAKRFFYKFICYYGYSD